MAHFAEKVAAFVASSDYDDLPDADRCAVERSIFDTVGTMLAGRTSAHGGMVEKFGFGVSQAGYRALKRVLQLHPFDSLPGLKHRYFFAGTHWKLEDSSDCGMKVRIEQGKEGKQVDSRVPKDLLANLRWFSELKDFSEAAHLAEVSLSKKGEI